MNQHKLVIDKNLILWDYNLSTKNLPPEMALKYQLMYQMSRITRDKGSLAHDDRLDSLAMAGGGWGGPVGKGGGHLDKRMLLRQDHLMLEEMKAWEGNAKGVNVKIGITNNPHSRRCCSLSTARSSKEMMIQVGISTIKD